MFFEVRNSITRPTEKMTSLSKEMLSRGFTTVRDTGGSNAYVAQATAEWLIPGPRVIQCGKALSQTVRPDVAKFESSLMSHREATEILDHRLNLLVVVVTNPVLDVLVMVFRKFCAP